MKRTFTYESLQQFLFMATNNPMESDMNPPGFLYENKDNANTELGTVIQVMIPVIDTALKPIKDIVQAHNRRVGRIKNESSDTVVMVENTGQQGKTITYTLTGENANKMNDKIAESFEEMEKERQVKLKESVEIEVTWVKQVPTNLKPYYSECFKGIVIPDGQQIIMP
jgi:aspartyl/asparaginyl-tRNA synthetase